MKCSKSSHYNLQMFVQKIWDYWFIIKTSKNVWGAPVAQQVQLVAIYCMSFPNASCLSPSCTIIKVKGPKNNGTNNQMFIFEMLEAVSGKII